MSRGLRLAAELGLRSAPADPYLGPGRCAASPSLRFLSAAGGRGVPTPRTPGLNAQTALRAYTAQDLFLCTFHGSEYGGIPYKDVDVRAPVSGSGSAPVSGSTNVHVLIGDPAVLRSVEGAEKKILGRIRPQRGLCVEAGGPGDRYPRPPAADLNQQRRGSGATARSKVRASGRKRSGLAPRATRRPRVTTARQTNR